MYDDFAFEHDVVDVGRNVEEVGAELSVVLEILLLDYVVILLLIFRICCFPCKVILPAVGAAIAVDGSERQMALNAPNVREVAP